MTQVSLVIGLQPRSYSLDKAKIAFLVSLLSGAVRVWRTGVWEKQDPLMNSFDAFASEMKKLFDHACLLSLTQGSRCVAEYAVEFRSLANETQWNDVWSFRQRSSGGPEERAGFAR